MRLVAGIFWALIVLYSGVAALGRTGSYTEMMAIIGVALLTYGYAYELGKANSKGGGE
jgi:hypothetical protein